MHLMGVPPQLDGVIRIVGHPQADRRELTTCGGSKAPTVSRYGRTFDPAPGRFPHLFGMSVQIVPVNASLARVDQLAADGGKSDQATGKVRNHVERWNREQAHG